MDLLAKLLLIGKMNDDHIEKNMLFMNIIALVYLSHALYVFFDVYVFVLFAQVRI